MTNIESNTDTNSEPVPGLFIYRPVLNITKEYVNNFNRHLSHAGLDDGSVITCLDPESKARIIGPGELRYLQQRLGIIATQEHNSELAEYLSETVPESYDTRLPIITKPVKEYRPDGIKGPVLFTIATDNPTIREERSLTQNAINNFYKIGRTALVTPEEAWLDYDYIGDVYLAVVKKIKGSIEVLDKFRHFLKSESKFMPNQIALGVASIDDVITSELF